MKTKLLKMSLLVCLSFSNSICITCSNEDKYSIFVDDGSKKYITFLENFSNEKIIEGSIIKFKVNVTDENKKLDKVLASGTEIKPENGVYKITLNKNEEIKVLLKDLPIQYSVNILNDSLKYITFINNYINGQKVDKNTIIEFTINNINENKKLDKVLASGIEIKPENGVYKITLNKNEEIKVLLKDLPIQYSVNILNDSLKYITFISNYTNGQKVDKNTIIEFTINNINENKKLDKVLASGTEIKPENGVYKITLNKNEEIKVLLKDNVTKINSEISKKLKNNNAESINLKEYANKTLFAYGITKENGWYDHDKLSILGINAPDNSYCWASTASGWIKWFFVQMSKEGYKIPEKYLINSEKYRSIIFEKFVENFNNTGSGGKTYFGLDYFLWKKYIYQNTTESFKIDNPRDKNDNGFGAFFEILKESGINEKSIDIEITSNKSGDKLENYMITTKDNKILKSIAFEEFMGYQYNKYGNKYKNRLDYFSKTVINALNNGGVVAILPNDGGHVINVWGVETNNAGIVNKLYITDSDDVKKYGKNKLICLELKENHGALFLNNYIGNGIFRGWQVFYKFPFTISELREIIKDN